LWKKRKRRIIRGKPQKMKKKTRKSIPAAKNKGNSRFLNGWGEIGMGGYYVGGKDWRGSQSELRILTKKKKRNGVLLGDPVIQRTPSRRV